LIDANLIYRKLGVANVVEDLNLKETQTEKQEHKREQGAKQIDSLGLS
jgi:hypothetical protein